MIAQAQDQTAATVTRIMLTFVGVVLFCLLSLLTPDVALLTGGERLNVPFAGPVSFLGFLVVGPAVLIGLRVYLQIYVEHWRRLEPLRRRLPGPSAPTVAPLENPLLRGFAGFVLYLLLPLTMLSFTWKAAILPVWGSGLLCVTVAVIAGHLLLPVRWPWWGRALLTAEAAIFAATIIYVEGPLSRPANLFQADLSTQWLPGSYLKGADLRMADLAESNLVNTNLSGANLQSARLVGTDLGSASLEEANLGDADLSGANLLGANLTGAKLWGGIRSETNPEGGLFDGARLVGAMLAGANLETADLAGANLAGANLMVAKLADADLVLANLENAVLEGANLAGAKLGFANLENARLENAVLEDANLEGANLAGAKLGGANLVGTDFRFARLEDARDLAQEQLDQACGDETTKLPPGLRVGTNCSSNEDTR